MAFSVSACVSARIAERKRPPPQLEDPEIVGFKPLSKIGRTWSWPTTDRDGALPTGLVPRGAAAMTILLAILNENVLAALTRAHSEAPPLNKRRFFEALAFHLYIQFVVPVPQPGVERHKLQVSFNAAREAFKTHMGVARTFRFEDFSRIEHTYFFHCGFHQGGSIIVIRVPCLSRKCGRFGRKIEKIHRERLALHNNLSSKPDGEGHWLSQVGVPLSETGFPFVTRIYPKDNCVMDGETCSMTDIIKWAVSWLPKQLNGSYPVLVLDARYLCRAGREALQQADIPYLASVNQQWFRPLCDRVAKAVTSPGQWEGLIKEKTGSKDELFIHYYSPTSGIGRRCILTNALQAHPSASRKPIHCPGWDEYASVFGVLDRFNRSMAGKYWSYRRKS